jgi:hypothetical protein
MQLNGILQSYPSVICLISRRTKRLLRNDLNIMRDISRRPDIRRAYVACSTALYNLNQCISVVLELGLVLKNTGRGTYASRVCAITLIAIHSLTNNFGINVSVSV